MPSRDRAEFTFAALCWRAFWRTGLAVLGIVVLLGIVFLPAELRRLNAPVSHSIAAFGTSAVGRFSVMLVHALPHEMGAGSKHRLVVQDYLSNTLRDVDIPFPARPTSLATCPDTTSVFVGLEDGSIFGIDLRQVVPQGILVGRHMRGVAHELACSRDGKTLISCDNGAVYAWDLEKWELRWCRLDLQLNCVAILPNSRCVVAQEMNWPTRRVVELDIRSGEILQVVDTEERLLHELLVSPNGELLAGIGDGGKVHLWRRNRVQPHWRHVSLPELRGGSVRVKASFSHDSRFLVVGDQDGRSVAIWDIDLGRQVCRLAGHDSPAMGAAFLGSEALLTWSADGRLEQWRWTEQALVRSDSVPPLS